MIRVLLFSTISTCEMCPHNFDKNDQNCRFRTKIICFPSQECSSSYGNITETLHKKFFSSHKFDEKNFLWRVSVIFPYEDSTLA